MDKECATFFQKMHVCKCVQNMLIKCGFDNFLSIKELNELQITDIQSFLQKNHSLLDDLPKCHGNIYKSQHTFEFLPAHRLSILKLPQGLEATEGQNTTQNLFSTDNQAFSPILKEMIESALKNFDKVPAARRYSKLLTEFSMHSYMVCGLSAYEILSSNLPIPKESTVRGYIHRNKGIIVEGQLRCRELCEHIEKIKAPKTVFISEDASGIVKKVVYDSKTNQLIGLVAPLKSENGSPIMFAYEASSAEQIQQYMELPQASLVYIVVAQPMKQHAPPFILQLFGSDNKFKSSHVLARWKYIERELKSFGIDVIGFSADGDPRLLSSMRSNVKFSLNELTQLSLEEWLKICSDFVYIQDTIHIATKLRNRLLKLSIMLPIGDKLISIAHIKMLLDMVDKEIHGLVLSDICPEDRQNFQSYEKITQPRVLTALEKYIYGSEGTVTYLKICEQITSSFLNPDLQPIERVYRIWNSVYFLRAWRSWLLRCKYRVNDHFISPNSYACIELNAHGLIYVINSLRNSNRTHMFLPHLMASQPCEHLFRQMRSMGSVNFTKINFNLFELLNMISRVELANKIIYSRINIEDTSQRISFPRVKKVLETDQKLIQLPTNEEIIEVMKKAQSDALKWAANLGMKMEIADVTSCELLQSNVAQVSDVIENESEDLAEDSFFDEDDTNVDADACQPTTVSHSKFIDLNNEDGSIKSIRKSTLIWMLTESKGKLSSDRLKRVQEAGPSPMTKRRKLNPQLREFTKDERNEVYLIKSDEVNIGDWCFFKQSNSMPAVELLSEEKIFENCVIGCIVGFRFKPLDNSKEKKRSSNNSKSKTRPETRSKMYSFDFAPTSFQESDNRKNEIQALASWYVCSENSEFKSFASKNHFFIDLKNYIATVKNLLLEPRLEQNSRQNDSNKTSFFGQSLVEIKSMLYKHYIE